MIFEQRATKSGSYHPSDINYWFDKLFGQSGMEADSGEIITADDADKIAAVYRCAELISSIGVLPVKYYRKQSDGGRREADTSPLWDLLHDMPNPEMAAEEYWPLVFGHLALRGNHFSQVIRSGRGRIEELWPLRPDRMVVERRNGKLLYTYTPTSGPIRHFHADEVFHVRGRMTDGLVGISPVAQAVNTLGLRRAQEKSAAKMFKNGFKLPFAWIYPGKFSKTENRRKLEEELAGKFGGTDNAGKAPVLEQGMDVKTIGMSAEDAEALAQAQFSVVEICRFMGVPPHMAYDLTRATFSNIEEQGIEWVRDGVRPRVKMVEGAIRRSLQPEQERGTHYAEFLLDDLLRGDSEKRWAAYQSGLTTGAYCINDVRKRENLNPIEGGDVHLVPMNYVPLDLVSDVALSNTEPTPPPENNALREARDARSALMRLRLRKAHRATFYDAFSRLVRREVAEIRKGIRKHFDQRDAVAFEAFLAEFYAGYRGVVADVVRPAVAAYSEAMRGAVADEVGATDPDIAKDTEDYVQSIGAHWAAGSEGALRALVQEQDTDTTPEERLEGRMEQWEEMKAEKFTNRKIVRAGEAFVVATLAVAGFTRKR